MPAKKTVEQPAPPEPEKAEEASIMEPLRKVMLAAIGAVALTQEEAEKFIKKLIERGEIAEQEGKKLMNEMLSRHKGDLTKANDEMSKRVSSAMKTMNFPTKADIDSLNEKIAELTKRLDEQNKSQ